ncbi:MAG TPA: spore germination protein [Candidatus Acidoferrum sp.]|nr:spore germination protein [Candidatus Acidoferrum sp.]
MRLLNRFGQGRRENSDETSQTGDRNVEKIVDALSVNLIGLKHALSGAQDLRVTHMRFGSYEGALVFIDGLVSEVTLTNAILRPIKNWSASPVLLTGANELLDVLAQEVLCAASTELVSTVPELAAGCLMGDTVLLVDGCANGLVINSKGWEKRTVTEPQSETVVRGPREGFTENLRTNTALIRRKIRNGRLKVEQLTVGRKTHTGVCLLYLDGVANPKVVEMVKSRIGKLDVDAVLETGYIEEYIEDAPFSPFSTIAYSEKPDVVAAKILEGRVAIAVDGTPFVLTVPMLLIESFQTAEDYYGRWLYSSTIRLLRYCSFLISVFAPAIYIALVSFQHELIPTTLLFSFAKSREGTPFPAFFEAIIMVIAFEILREAGVRLPRPVGQAISIVGALIMGDAAVRAGLIGAPMVIVIAITAVAGFVVPTLNDAASMLRVIMMVMASFTGFYGVAFGFLGMLVHLATLESFGVPFLGDFDSGDAQDAFVRMPLWTLVKRPKDIALGDTTRGRRFIPPLRPHAKDENEDEP